jgi:glycosyltransferase 2 family protein
MKKRIFKALIVLSSAIILIILIFFTNSLDELVMMFKNARLYWLAVAFGCMVMYWVFDVMILHVITRGLLEKQPLKDTIRVTMIGQFFNSITPLSGAGQPVQAYVMVKDGIKPGHAASIIIIKTLLHQLIIVMYSLVTFTLKGSQFGARIPQFYYLYILGLAFNSAFLLFYVLFIYKKEVAGKVLSVVFRLLGKLKFIKKTDSLQEKVEKELMSFSEGAGILKNNASIIIRLIIFQIVQFTFYFSIPYFIHLAVANNAVRLWDMIAAQSMITLISLLVPSPGATGGVEGLSYLFYGMFFTQSFIIPVILIYRILTYYASVIFGGLFAFFAPEKPLKQTR